VWAADSRIAGSTRDDDDIVQSSIGKHARERVQ
jgi:hypothetical protein